MTKRKHDVIIVGAGLFGSMAAKFAAEEGHRVIVIDDARPYRASPASGCVLAPSWLTAIPKDDVARGMNLLHEHYGLEPLDFGIPGFKAQRVRTAKVLKLPLCTHIKETVTEVGDGWVRYGEGLRLKGKVLVAAGIWAQELLRDVPAITGLYGCSLLVSGHLEQPRLKVYAPYRQAVAFNMDNKNVWFGDGTALIERTWMKEEDARREATARRFRDYTGIRSTPRVIAGARPYIKGHMGYFRAVAPNTWVSTGGAKNGTLLAALQAEQFLKELP